MKKEYYKPVFGLLLAAFLLVGVLGGRIAGAQEEILLSVVVVDADRGKPEQYERLKESLKGALGSGGRKESVEIDTSATSNDEPEAVINLTMKLSVVQEHDVVILNRETWERFDKEHPFADWSEVLSGESLEKLEPYIEGSALCLSESDMWRAGGYVRYESAYLCVLERSERKEAAGRLAEYIFEPETERREK